MTSNKPLTIDYLDISKTHLYRLTSTGKIPHYKPNGKRLYFYQADLDSYIQSGKVKTSDEMSDEVNNHMVQNGV